MEIIIVPSIAALVYFLITLYKQVIPEGKKKYLRIIPLISGLLGIAFGILVFFTAPQLMPTDNIIVAMLIGGASGLSATGTNQIFQQLCKCKTDKENEKKQ